MTHPTAASNQAKKMVRKATKKVVKATKKSRASRAAIGRPMGESRTARAAANPGRTMSAIKKASQAAKRANPPARRRQAR